MFGYIQVNKDELKLKDYNLYQMYYCGLCETLKKRYGLLGEMAVNYDMTFVCMLLDGLYDTKMEKGSRRCIVHPFSKKPIIYSVHQEYAADMSLFLMYLKCLDDWHDEKKISRLLYARALKPKIKKIHERYPDKTEKIVRIIKESMKLEKNDNTEVDEIAGYTGRFMSELFFYKEDEWKNSLADLGFYLGKFIYICDAYEDVEGDIKNNHFNPLKNEFEDRESDDFEKYCYTILKMMIAKSAVAFEQLPVIDNVQILRNIIYSGVWYPFQMISQKRKGDKKHEGSISGARDK